MLAICDDVKELGDDWDVDTTILEEVEVSDVEFDGDNGEPDVELTVELTWRLTRSFAIEWS